MKKQHCLRSFFAIFWVVFYITFITGCQQVSSPLVTSPEEALRSRAEQVLAAQLNNDWGKVYDLSSAKYRASISKENFINLPRSLYYSDLAVTEINIAEDGKKATVKTIGNYSAMGRNFKNVPTIQTWVKEDGQWYQKISSFKDLFTQ